MNYLKKLYDKILKFFQKVKFNIEVKYSMLILKNIKDNIFTYPMLVSLTFDKKYYWNNYIKGISVINSIKRKANILNNSMLRHIGRNPSDEVSARYRRFKERYNNRIEVLENFGIDLNNYDNRRKI